MLNFGLGEIIVVAVVALVFVGPERLPEMLRYLGRMYGKLRAATYEIRREFTIEVDRVVAEERATLLKHRREEARKRLEEERMKRMQETENSEVENTPEEYTPFDSDPPPNAAPVPDTTLSEKPAPEKESSDDQKGS
jgi:sec-independent protein translocase protein TatB